MAVSITSASPTLANLSSPPGTLQSSLLTSLSHIRPPTSFTFNLTPPHLHLFVILHATSPHRCSKLSCSLTQPHASTSSSISAPAQHLDPLSLSLLSSSAPRRPPITTCCGTAGGCNCPMPKSSSASTRALDRDVSSALDQSCLSGRRARTGWTSGARASSLSARV